MIKIGTRIDPGWLNRPQDLRFLRQIGVDVVDVTLDIFPGYRESGQLRRESVQAVVEVVDGAGLKIERANSTNAYSRAIFMDEPGAGEELDRLVANVALCGEYGFPVVGIQCFQAAQFGGFPRGVFEWVEGRGGYRHLKVDLRDALNRPAPDGAPTHEELWERTLEIFRATAPVAEAAGTRVAMHGNDPPVPSLYGVPQVLYDFAAFDRLFSEVPSPANGMTFCVGTRYESGEDVFEGIRRFGGQGKIFHVHFRNVRGTIPATGGYEEVIPDQGDLNMFQVVRALHDVGFEGAIDYDHIMELAGDEEGRAYIAFCVGQMHGFLQALETERQSRPRGSDSAVR